MKSCNLNRVFSDIAAVVKGPMSAPRLTPGGRLVIEATNEEDRQALAKLQSIGGMSVRAATEKLRIKGKILGVDRSFSEDQIAQTLSEFGVTSAIRVKRVDPLTYVRRPTDQVLLEFSTTEIPHTIPFAGQLHGVTVHVDPPPSASAVVSSAT